MKRKNSPGHLGGVPAGSGSSEPGRIPGLERARYIVVKRRPVNLGTPGAGPASHGHEIAARSPLLEAQLRGDGREYGGGWP